MTEMRRIEPPDDQTGCVPPWAHGSSHVASVIRVRRRSRHSHLHSSTTRPRLDLHSKSTRRLTVRPGEADNNPLPSHPELTIR